MNNRAMYGYGQIASFGDISFAFAKLVIGLSLFVAALNNLPHGIHIGPTNFNVLIASISVPITYFTIVLLARIPISGSGPLLIYMVFLVYVGLYLTQVPYNLQALQNVTLYLATGGLAMVAFQCAGRHQSFARFLWNGIKLMVWLASALYLLFLALGLVGFNGLFSPRSYALIAVIGCAVYVAEARSANQFALLKAGIFCFLCIITISRTASAVACLVMASYWVNSEKRSSRFLALISLGSAVAIFILIAAYVPSFNASFTGGDGGLQLGPFSINTKGRLFWWSLLWESYLLSPMIGHGPGSFTSTFFIAVQPHNDHLRLLHDFGYFGYGIWWAAIGGALLKIVQGWRIAARHKLPEAAILMGTFLYSCTFLIVMLTDNVLIYPPNVFPFAIMLGGALGIAGRLIAAKKVETERQSFQSLHTPSGLPSTDWNGR